MGAIQQRDDFSATSRMMNTSLAPSTNQLRTLYRARLVRDPILDTESSSGVNLTTHVVEASGS
jgi:hypothetical protein